MERTKKLKREVYALFEERRDITIADVLSKLDFGLPIKRRFTFSFDSQVKEVMFFYLKEFKSYEALTIYLQAHEEEALKLGFYKEDRELKIPSRRAIAHFVATLDKEYKTIIETTVSEIGTAADRFNVVLDTIVKKRRAKAEKELSTKTVYNIKEEKIREIITILKKKIYKRLKLNIKSNSIFSSSDFIDELVYIGLTQDFAETGSKMASELFHKTMPSADTLFYHLKKTSDWKVFEKVFITEILDYVLKIAEQNGILSDRKMDVAIDETPWRFYGKHNTRMVVGTKPERGTQWCFKFISLDVIAHNSRFTLCALPVIMDDENEMADLVIELVEFAKQRIHIGKLLMDRGFVASSVINGMNRLGVQVLIPAKSNLDAVKKNKHVKGPAIVPNWFMGHCRINLIIAELDGQRREFITNIPLTEKDAVLGQRLAEIYRTRWQIETGYRVKKYAFRGKTCSRNYSVRYFYFMLSVVLYDLWVLLDLMIMNYLGLRTTKTMITARMFSAKILMIKEPAG